MELKNIFKTTAIALLLGGAFSSCSDNDDPAPTIVINTDTYRGLATSMDYTADGYWADCYESNSNNGFTSEGFHYTHAANVTEWDGIKYYSWTGFTPSKAYDMTDFTDGDWVAHQWSPMIRSGIRGTVCLIANYSVSEAEDEINNAVLKITAADGKTFSPALMQLTNTTYGYYAMKNGTAFNKAFDASDWTRITALGILKGQVISRSYFELASAGHIVDDYTNWDLTGLGEVDAIVFKMSSSDSGQWGMNVPAYFAIGSFSTIGE